MANLPFESTNYRTFREVKQRRTRLVSGWVARRELQAAVAVSLFTNKTESPHYL